MATFVNYCLSATVNQSIRMSSSLFRLKKKNMKINSRCLLMLLPSKIAYMDTEVSMCCGPPQVQKTSSHSMSDRPEIQMATNCHLLSICGNAVEYAVPERPG